VNYLKRPILDQNISLADFNDFYWLKVELGTFCKHIGIPATGGKIEMAEKIRHYLLSGEIQAKKKGTKTPTSNFDWNKEKLARQTIITDSYKNTANVRLFFKTEIGSHFSFNVIFMKWMKDHIGKTLDEAIQEWNRIKILKKDKNYLPEIEPQFEYNQYIRAFSADNPTLSGNDARKFWKLKRAKRGSNAYERNDLSLVGE
jgi:hypothetical protein